MLLRLFWKPDWYEHPYPFGVRINQVTLYSSKKKAMFFGVSFCYCLESSISRLKVLFLRKYSFWVILPPLLISIRLRMILWKTLGCLKQKPPGSSPRPLPSFPHSTTIPEKVLFIIYFFNQLMLVLGHESQSALQNGLNMKATATKLLKWKLPGTAPDRNVWI